jgi:ribulose-phosphate 3-epimerase
LAINPDGPVELLEPYLPDMDLALCMTVFPGFGGQAYIGESPDRIRRLRGIIDRLNPKCELEVDGGIEVDTAKLSVDAGANVLVAGTAIFGSKAGIAAAIRSLRERVG